MVMRSAGKMAASAQASGCREEKAHRMRLWECRQLLQQQPLLRSLFAAVRRKPYQAVGKEVQPQGDVLLPHLQHPKLPAEAADLGNEEPGLLVREAA